MQSMLKMKMTFDLQSKMEVIEACFILVTFALFFSNAFSLFPFNCQLRSHHQKMMRP